MYIENLNKIKEYLTKNNIDAFIVFSNDDHGSEYVVDYYKAREFLTGFTGSAGTLIVTQKESYLFTDGRYFLQAAEQLKQSGVILMKMGEENVPTIYEFLSSISSTLRVSFDFSIATANFVKGLLHASPNTTLIDNDNLIDDLWENRPQLVASNTYMLDTMAAGESISSKIDRLKEKIYENGCKAALISSLDDIAWLLNLRGDDIKYNPVNLAYVIVKEQATILYINKNKVNAAIENTLNENKVYLKEYNEVYNDIEKIEDKILYDASKTNFKLITLMQNKYSPLYFPTVEFKAIKNKVEIKNIKKAHIKDGVAMCKFMYFLKTFNYNKNKLTEIQASDYLLKLRSQQKGFIEPSFATICGYADHGAIVHYSSTEKTNATLKNQGLLLVDSGGQYKYGTTDVTRTFALGKLSQEEKEAYTLVLKAHIALSMATFKKNTRSATLDILARKPLWDKGLDFNHGTGHGVGYLLNVHEGPQNINYKQLDTNSGYRMLEGMVTSNEPGLYIEGKFGIRHENLVLCVKKKENNYGCFLGFENLTLVPFDLDAIDASLLTSEEKQWLNNYHQNVYSKINGSLNEKERKFLADATREIK